MALRFVMIEFLWIFVLNVALPPVEGCGWNTTALNGIIESPNFPNKYPDGQTCVYIITAPRNHRVTLTFTHFDVEARAGCPFDFVEIRDGDGQSSNLLGRFCDNSLPGPVRTFSNQMRIKFGSDSSVTQSGFRATFTSDVADVDRFPFFLITSTVSGLLTGGSIFRMDVETRSNLPIPMASPPYKPFAVDYDPVQQTIYWTEVGDIFKGIVSSFLNGSQTTIVRNLGSDSAPEGLAVDSLSSLIFYTDSARDVIAMITMSTLAHRTVIDSGLDQPLAIVLDTVNGVMFWTDRGGRQKIERANYDGTDRRTLHEDFLYLPNALALDVANSRLYWVDAGTDLVERSDLDGNGRTTLLTLKHHLFGLALFENALYITDWGKLGPRSNSSQLIRLKLDGSKNTTVYWSLTSKRLIDIHACSTQVSSGSSSMNGCSNKNGGCAVICVPLPGNNSRCLCPDGQRLTRDQRTCVNGSDTTPSISTSRTSTTTTTATTTTTIPPVLSVLVSTSDPQPFDTKGDREMTLTCNVDPIVGVISYTWNVPCTRQTGNTCVFTPRPPKDDRKTVTCTVTSSDGRTAEGWLKLALNYPPQEAPTINGHTKDAVYQEGDKLTMTCSVHGGRPLVKSVLFSCGSHHDISPDVSSLTEVHSILTIDPLMAEDDGKHCFCFAHWKDTDWYRLSATAVLRVNGSYQVTGRPTQPESLDTFVLQASVPVIGGAGGGVVLLIVIVILIACIVVRRRRGRERYARPSNPKHSVSQEHDYSQLGASRSPARVIQPCFPNEMFGERPSSDYDDVEEDVRSSNYETLGDVAAELLALPDDYLTPTVSEQQACQETTVSDPVPCSWDKQSSSDSSYLHPIDSPGDLDDIPPTP